MRFPLKSCDNQAKSAALRLATGFHSLLRGFQIFHECPVFRPAAASYLSNSPSFSIEASDVPVCAHDMHIAHTFWDRYQHPHQTHYCCNEQQQQDDIERK